MSRQYNNNNNNNIIIINNNILSSSRVWCLVARYPGVWSNNQGNFFSTHLETANSIRTRQRQWRHVVCSDGWVNEARWARCTGDSESSSPPPPSSKLIIENKCIRFISKNEHARSVAKIRHHILPHIIIVVPNCIHFYI